MNSAREEKSIDESINSVYIFGYSKNAGERGAVGAVSIYSRIKWIISYITLKSRGECLKITSFGHFKFKSFITFLLNPTILQISSLGVKINNPGYNL